MTRTEYLEQLDSHLRKLPTADYEEAMAYFKEYFDEAGEENEAMVMAELGTPRDAARELIANILDKKIMDDRHPPRSKSQMIWLVILAIFAIPVGVPLIFLILGLLGSLVAMVVGLLIMAGFGVLGLTIGGFIFIIDAFAYLGQPSLFALGFGGGLAMLGGSMILALLTYLFARLTGRGLKTLVTWIIRKGQRV